MPIFCFVFLAFSLDHVSAATCGDSSFFTPNDTYDTNRRLILSTLASNVSSQGGFYNVSVGEGPGRIYALGMCIPGAEPQTCSDCIQGSSEYLSQNCPNQTDSYDWSPQKTLCLVRYSNSSFFNKIDLEPYSAEYYTGDIPGNVTEFNSKWEDLMTRMIAAASSSRMHYAADVIPLTGFINMHALMQCIPGMSSGDCQKCLLENVRAQQECCSKNRGGAVRRPACFSRSDISPFFSAFDHIRPSPPPQAPQTMPSPDDLPGSTKKDVKTISRGTVIAIVLSAAIIVALLALGLVLWRKRKSNKITKFKSFVDDDITNTHIMQFDFKTLNAATDNFSPKNKIGRGGFGVVYKGTLSNGTRIAVKRLSVNSGQGLTEFKNEVTVLAGLQHTNLVRILGFCLEGEEQILVYEFLPNKSLDCFLFDPVKQGQLNWSKRYDIIGGITRGMLYLHHESRVTIIHRDLKASNILLDEGMKPKIADFGMARIFGNEQTRANTSKIAGTFGYMAPEYVMHGRISMKSDVYSFGVLLLEIISGKMNIGVNETDESVDSLVTHAWRLWRKRSPLELLDSTFGENYQSDDVTRCIHIGLLCVQEDPAYRPPLTTIILMLTNSTMTLPEPRQTRFLISE
ncbi:unnamed protein product [Microthlaspi erraticum]|uniref:Protein kinase domain-containing protein n=1 Tax=Microthlaspi erraticum TaxID=1685480 RepID=A0A6D2HNQ4_9BRAS|nr:unnamed protein product [Microthlaspi erraticum]